MDFDMTRLWFAVLILVPSTLALLGLLLVGLLMGLEALGLLPDRDRQADAAAPEPVKGRPPADAPARYREPAHACLRSWEGAASKGDESRRRDAS